MLHKCEKNMEPGGQQCTFNDSFSARTDNVQFRRLAEDDQSHVQISKVQDILRQKILKRPDRQFLIEHHILKDTNVAPSLQVREQSLKKARLADNLNDKLLKRPGPLELVEHNILVTDPAVKEVIKDGLIPYEKTSSSCEQHDGFPPYLHFLNNESRDSSESLLSVDPWSDWQQATSTTTTGGDPTHHQYHHQGDAATADLQQYSCPPPPSKAESPFMWWENWAVQQGPGENAAGQAIMLQAPPWPPEGGDSSSRNIKKRRNGVAAGGGRGWGRSKSALIFHEYQGPSTLNRRSKHFSRGAEQSAAEDNVAAECGGSAANKRTVLDTYKVLLHQQQIFLELLHDLQLSEDVAASMVKEQEKLRSQQMQCWRSSSDNVVYSNNDYGSTLGRGLQGAGRAMSPTNSGSPPCSAVAMTDRSADFTQSLDALSRLRVSDLRDECRQRGLFVSGTKQDLIKRITRHDALQINEAFKAGKLTGAAAAPTSLNSNGAIEGVDPEADQNFKRDDLYGAGADKRNGGIASIRLKAAGAIASNPSAAAEEEEGNPTRRSWSPSQVAAGPALSLGNNAAAAAKRSNIATRTIQDLNFAELFAAVDAASSSGSGWAATGFDDLFVATGKQVSTKPLL